MNLRQNSDIGHPQVRTSAPASVALIGLGLILSWPLTPLLVRASEQGAIQADQPSIKFGMSSRLFREVNENDARASVRAYAKQIAESQGLIADPSPRIFASAAEVIQLLSAGEVDLISLPTREFLALPTNLVTGPFLISVINGSAYEEYVVAVPADSKVKALSDLKGGRVLVLDSLQGSLAGPWLDVLLAEQQLGAAETVFGHVARPVKIAQTVLPVFFKQGDACVVTAQGLGLMGELNPQVTNQLRVVARSPRVVPHLTCFRVGFDPSLRAKLILAVTGAHTTPGGRQLLTMFQCEHIEETPLSKLAGTVDLVAAHTRLRRDRIDSGAAPSLVPPSPPGGQSQ